MDSTAGLFEIEYDDQKKKMVIINNWIIMLYNRGWLNGNLNDIVKSAVKLDNDTCTIKGINITYSLKFIMRKISTIRKMEDIDEFLEQNQNNYKFFIVSQMVNKAQKQLLEYEKVEVFTDDELLVNTIDNILVPKHILLTDKETEQYLTEYHIRRLELPRILTSDPIAKYYNVKPGQIVKIIRPSVTSGEEIIFRVCVPG